jgi:CheY-like chemotaxis protein
MPYQIIIADDDADLRAVFRRITQRVYPAAIINTVADGDAALDLYAQHGADLLLAAQVMTPVDGPTLIRTLRAHGATLPIIATSSTPSAQTDMLAAGATVFLIKLDAVDQLEMILPTLLPVEP